MQYRENKAGEPLSILGFGCMRFKRKGSGIDMDLAEEQIMAAMENGVNYFDTAYIYPGSEAALGEILEKNNARDKVNIATKLPQYLVPTLAQAERYFQEELRRLRTDRIDYYLMHMLTDIAAWNKLKKLGIEDWIEEKKRTGQIRQIGFSFHGDTEMFKKILADYDWDFCQIQYNYLDEHTQAGRGGVEAAAEKGIPVIIMEPLRGGKLVDLMPEKGKKLVAADPKHRTAAELAFRWLWNQPEVTVVLSGMNSLKMVEENCATASSVQAGELTADDFALYDALKAAINEKVKVPCTGCSYCMPCPHGVDIPAAFRCYNEMYTEKKSAGRKEYWQTVSLRKTPAFPTQCVACGRCERHCPQHIHIIAELKNANRALRPFPWNVAGVIAAKVVAGRG